MQRLPAILFEPAESISALLPLMDADFVESNPIPVKAALAMMGLIEENYRLPMVPISSANREKLQKIVEQTGLLQSEGVRK